MSEDDSLVGRRIRFTNEQIVATTGVIALVDQPTIARFVARHFTGDWGEVDAHDAAQNEKALRRGYGIAMSVFRFEGEKVWVHSYIGGDEAYTTVLLPEEY